MKEKRHIGPLLLLLGVLASNMYFGDVNIGPASPRLYFYGAAVVWVFTQCVIGRKSLGLEPRAQLLLVFYVLFILWTLLALILQEAPLETLVDIFVRYHAIAIATFFITLFCVRTRADVGRLLSGLVALFLVSGCIALLQWHFVPWSWDIWHRLRPYAEFLPGEPGLVQNQWGYKRIAIAGLFGSAVTFGYYIAVLTPVVFRRFMARRSLMSLAALCITLAAAVVVQQRAAVLAGVLCCFVLGFYKLRERGRSSKLLPVVVLVAAILAGVVYLGSESDAAAGPATKYAEGVDTGRLQIAGIALRHIARHPGLGGAREYEIAYERETDASSRYMDVLAPHNLFLNAAVFYGTPALLLIVAFLAVLGTIMARVWFAARARNDWTSMTLVMSIVAYLMVAQFHNASFVTGDALPWVLIAAMLTASREAAAQPARAAVAKRRAAPGLRVAGEMS
ncbi:MAG: hypothetical protein QOJ98_1354 [Acidobacteriota bacterium]|jgi:O-antigen ligase|nr:hypothetical protein [Acidobacteriota bacterium]